MINFHYNSDDGIIYVERSGKIGLDDLLNYLKEMGQEFGNLESHYIIDDVRNSYSDFGRIDYPFLIDMLKQDIKKYREVRHAFIVDKPSDTVLAMLYEKLTGDIDNYTSKTFSTIEGAQAWIMQGSYYESRNQ